MLELSKHEGAGNDFLVALGPAPAGPELARALCDRRRGVGADGLIVVVPGEPGGAGVPGADLSMRLWNADGSEAEMSGNGIRCLAQAAVIAGLVSPPRFTVATAAGVRSVDYEPGPGAADATASVDMGEVRLGADLPDLRATEVDVGNPHLVVLVDDVDAVDLRSLAAELAPDYPRGVNVEVVAPRPGGLAMRVWERGAGETLACGTGSCAAAAAARHWGLVGDRVQVVNPGGPLEVRLEGTTAVLAGPVRRVAGVTVALGGALVAR
ncbi:MAG: diaminopimelate epimerase [Acidimicrobiales bacterium]